ncbi:lipopolysaccharide heptosyltransferase II [Candidatus Albibeggiatoa sp. nov. BB20]|uniref:lipopolysaccharide heptosyltransferase II n=1 Tax=Candidatus Albibeggiatoa sp. nov. BB20 TaxID=3162723 RepID=UPI00336558E6
MLTSTQTPAILVIAPSWVGDMVMAQSLFKFLKLEHQNTVIDVLAPQWSAGLLKLMPEVRRIICHDIQHGELAWDKRRQLGEQLRCERYQQVIVLPNSWKSALIPYWTKASTRTGYKGEMRYGLLNDRRLKNKLTLRRTVDQFVALGMQKHDPRIGHITPPTPYLSTGNIARSLEKLNLEHPHQPILALCPGAEYGIAKQWPLEYYAILAKKVIAQGWKVWILGSPKDSAVGARVEALSGSAEIDCISFCGQTDLADAVNLLSLANAVVTNDSGLMHVAAALDKKVIAIYGSSTPVMTPPLSRHAKILYNGISCSPCFKRTCRYQHYQCLRSIKPEQVLNLLL